MFRLITAIISITVLLASSTARSDESSASRLVEPGEYRAIAAGGIAIIDRDIRLGMEGSLEVGLLPALTIAAPLALTLRILETSPGSGLYLSGGVVDFNITSNYDVIYTPALVLGGQAILGPESTLRGTIDVTSARREFEKDAFGLWIRGSLAVIIDFGPFATIAAGASYQRVIHGGGAPQDGMLQAGWVSDSRVSFGAVRSQPFYDLPTLSIHLGKSVDIFAMFRIDVDLHRDVNDTRILAGLEIH